jgi:D-glycero-D-manno-heptose 1,7-bisphosphate phosphatase
VLNLDKGYAFRPDDIQWVDGAIAAIGYFNQKGVLVIVVTNQSGVARGYYTEADVRSLHKWMNDQLKAQGSYVDAFYFCPHHPEGTVAELRQECTCRKPQPGMLQQAIIDWNIDTTQSFLVGDKESDTTAAEAVGLEGYLFSGGDLLQFLVDIKKIDQR